MEVINLQGTENPMFFWSPLREFDEPIWGGFGEFDQLKQVPHLSEASNEDWYVGMDLDTEGAMLSPKGRSSPGILPFECLQQSAMTESSGNICHGFRSSSYPASESSSESSSNKSWYSRDCLDLASVLDTTFVSSLSVPIPSPQLLEGPVEEYPVYDEHMIPAPPVRVLSDKCDVFVENTFSTCSDSAAVAISRDLQCISAAVSASSKDSESVVAEEAFPVIENVTTGRTENNRDGEFGDDTDYGKGQARVTESSCDIASATALPSTSPFPLECKTSEVFSYLPTKKESVTYQVNQGSLQIQSNNYLDCGSGKQFPNTHVAVETTMTHQDRGWQNTIGILPKRRKDSDGLKSSSSTGTTDAVPYCITEKGKRAHRHGGNHTNADSRAKKSKFCVGNSNQKLSKPFPEPGWGNLPLFFPAHAPTSLYNLHSSPLLQMHSHSPTLHSPIAPNVGLMQVFGRFFEEAQSSRVSEPTNCIPKVSTEPSHTFPILESTFPLQGYSVDDQDKNPLCNLLHQQEEPTPGPVLSKRHCNGLTAATQESEMPKHQFLSENYPDKDLVPSPLQTELPQKDFCQDGRLQSNSEKTNSNLDCEDFTEVKVLQQLKTIVEKLSLQARLMIRESLYRLAKSANERSIETIERTINSSFLPSGISSSEMQIVEAKTNHVDRWIANLLFCKQPAASESKSCQLSSSMSIQFKYQKLKHD